MKEVFKKHRDVLEELIGQFTSGELFELDLEEVIKNIPAGNKVSILGAGKASVQMAQRAEKILGDRIRDGIIIAPESSVNLDRVQVFEGAHPYPDENSVAASYELRNFAQHIPPTDVVLFLLSGGASSLLCIPSGHLELDDLKATHELLLNSGANIEEMNIVRKHLSDIAGGKLGAQLADHQVLSVILSDVPGDDPQVIGSAPTIPDPSTFKQAFQILKQYSIWCDIPHSARVHITKGMHGDAPETIKPEKGLWKKHQVEVVSGAQILAKKTSEYLSELGFNSDVEDHAYEGDVKKVSKKICSQAIGVLKKKDKMKLPAALVYYGECTVSVKGEGKGGRNQEMALSMALSIEGQHPISMLSLATDGIDGPTDAAGAIISSETCLEARKKKLVPEDYLQSNDSYHFHEKMKTQIKTGATGLNLMDLQVALIGKID